MDRMLHIHSSFLRVTLVSTMLHHLPFLRFLKLTTRLLYEHGLIHHVLKIHIVITNDLNLQTRVESLLELLLMCIICGNVLRGITRELNELIEVLTY